MAEQLTFVPVLNRPDLVAPAVATFVQSWKGTSPAMDFLVAEIDPDSSGGADFCARYGVPQTEGANCVVIEGKRGTTSTLAAIVVPVGFKTDFNAVRKRMGVRQVSLAPMEVALSETGMEYGSITPVGLPASWPIFIDHTLVQVPRIVIGGGLKRSKLSVPGKALSELPGAIIVDDLLRPNQ